jgi:hypothetical protein
VRESTATVRCVSAPSHTLQVSQFGLCDALHTTLGCQRGTQRWGWWPAEKLAAVIHILVSSCDLGDASSPHPACTSSTSTPPLPSPPLSPWPCSQPHTSHTHAPTHAPESGRAGQAVPRAAQQRQETDERAQRWPRTPPGAGEGHQHTPSRRARGLE